MLIYAHIIWIVLQNVISVDCDNNEFYKKIIDLVEYIIDIRKCFN